MNDMKINMVKFLMTMFNTNIDTINDVELFKMDVDELVRRNQISPSTRDLVYSMYGILNTNVFKPKQQEEKLMQIESMMRLGERIRSTGNLSAFSKFKENVELGVKQGTISKSARDIIFAIYDLDVINMGTNMNTPKSIINKPNNNSKTTQKVDKTKDRNKEVKEDIARFKSPYVSEIYYEWENPSYDGCSNSQKYKRKKLVDSTERPVVFSKLRFVYYKEIYNDGCHSRYDYIEVPKEWYISAANTTVKAPVSNTGFCTGGGFSMRNC